MRIISDLFRTFAAGMMMCSGTFILTALANVHPQYSYWKLKRRASVLQVESGKFKIEQGGVRRFTYIRGLVVSCLL